MTEKEPTKQEAKEQILARAKRRYLAGMYVLDFFPITPKVWREALTELRQTGEVVVVGYDPLTNPEDTIEDKAFWGPAVRVDLVPFDDVKPNPDPVADPFRDYYWV